MTNIKNSYTAADSIPIKLIKNYDLLHSLIVEKRILPLHVQFIPTNRCNLKCSFCSCSNDDRKKEMSFDDAKRIIDILHKLGTKTVTVTGGGEPFLYPHFQDLLSVFHNAGIQIGLVTNGLLLDRFSYEYVTWCRISNSDERNLDLSYLKVLRNAVENNLNVDWAFSHVTSSNPSYKGISRIIELANLYNFTHVRIVADLLDYENVNLDKVKEYLLQNQVDISKVIFQSRNAPTRGGNCYICYLKPMIGADCNVYCCCGIMYALKKPSKCMPKELCLGSAFDLDKIIDKSHIPFNGKICYRCYYMNYNHILENVLSDTEHMDFV